MKEKYYLIGTIEETEGRSTSLLGDFESPDDAVKQVNTWLAPRTLGPRFVRPFNIFLIKGVRIPIEINEVASVKTI